MGRTNYDIKSIKTLESIEAIRTRPGMYIGSVGPEGLWQITLEIISNAIDEYLVGECNAISVNIDGPFITVTDNGRGVPFGKNSKGEETLVNIYTKLHTGAKFDSHGNTGYNTSGGMNGVGAKATNALSSFFRVDSFRDQKHAHAIFERGKLIEYQVEPFTGGGHGTNIRFSPDPKIFKEGTDCDVARLKKQLKELAYLSPGLQFTLIDNGNQEQIESKNGLLDYLSDVCQNKEQITQPFYAEAIEERSKIRVAMQYTNTFVDTYKIFTNSIPNSSGTHLTGFRTALTQTINTWARTNGILKEKDENLTGDDLKEGLVLILSLNLPDPIFSGQTKDVLTSAEGRTIVQRLCAPALMNWFNAHEKDTKQIINKALLARKARDSARKAKENVRAVAIKQSRVTLPGKLADCNSKNRKECEIFIVEGDSASGTAKEARDRTTQAILPLRGKILNVLKTDLSKAMANEEIKSMIIGFGLQVKDNKIVVDEDKLRYGKIIVMSDADVK